MTGAACAPPWCHGADKPRGYPTRCWPRVLTARPAAVRYSRARRRSASGLPGVVSRIRAATALVIAGSEGARWTGVGRQLRALMLSPLVPQRLTMYVSSTSKRQADLEALRQQIEAGHLTPVVGKTYPLADVPEAIRHLEGGRAQGKIAITI
jgi:hypothetical protein